MQKLACYRQSTGDRVVLDPEMRLGKGGEGEVYALAGSPLVAKFYPRLTLAERARQSVKLELMMEQPPLDPERVADKVGIAWPVDRLVTTKGVLAGYLMPRLELSDALPAVTLYNPQSRSRHWPQITWRQNVRAVIRIAGMFGTVHRQGYVVGDISESNCLIGRDGRAVLLDTDSFGFRRGQLVFACPVGRPTFLPPELHRASLIDVERLPQHDRFSIAVLLYLMLMEGEHPFASLQDGCPVPLEESIRDGAFCRAPGRRTRSLAPPYGLLSDELQTLFWEAFIVGHEQPARRPDPAAWQSALTVFEQRLQRCDRNAWHVFGGHLTACPWCERDRLLGRDPWSRTERREL